MQAIEFLIRKFLLSFLKLENTLIQNLKKVLLYLYERYKYPYTKRDRNSFINN